MHTAPTEIYTDWHTRSLHDALPIEMPELPGDISGNGIQPTDEEVEGKANQLVIGKIASLNLRGNAIAQQVIAWCRLTVSDFAPEVVDHLARGDRKSTRLNSSH